jgi:TonB-dependent receptor
VRRKASLETVNTMLTIQKNSASVSDFITAEQIRRTPDRSTGDVIKRVSGASIQDDRFAIIRGLNDRYNAAFINGAPLPSTESDRKAFAFDIFPASILDNLVIYKTATPDKSGEFAGGIIDITTKSILPKNFTSISFGGSYNTLITGNNRYYSETKGKKDWMGIDDGTRAIPSGIPPREDFNSITPTQKSELAKLFGNYKWGIKQRNTGPNYNFQLSKGFNIERKEKEFLGVLMSLSYNRNYTFTDGQRNTYEIDLSAPANAELKQNANYKDSSYNDEVVLAALGNISVKLDNRNSISWKNNLSVNTDNRIIKRTGNPDFTANPSLSISEAVRWFTSNKIYSSQLSGEHQAGPLKTKINWLAAYSKVNREIPNLARTSYSGGSAAFPPVPSQTVGAGSMFFSNSDENIKSVKADISQPYTFMKNTQNLLKAGGGYQIRKREFTSRTLGFIPNNFTGNFDYSLIQLPEDQIFLPQHLGKLKNSKEGFLLEDGTLNNSDYDASSAMTHAYIMNDQRFFEKFRLIYGVRMESFNQKLNAIRDNNDTVRLNTTVTDFLPSANFVYAVTPKMNLRLSYSQTINRPEFRELAPFLFFDYATAVTYQGDPALRRAKIDNYDFRFEFFPGRAQVFSASAFYKDFTNPIEIIQIPNTSSQTKYVNTQSAKVYGVEVEFRTLVSTLFGIKKENALLSKFTLAGNAAYIKSDVIIGPNVLPGIPSETLVTNRALQGQSPYIINGSLGFNDEKTGLSSTLSVNRVGDRVILSGTKINPNIYEKARTVVDFQVAKFFVKNILELKFTVRDILAKDIGFYFDIDESKSFTERDRYFGLNRAPRVFNFSATYKF